MPTKTRIPPTPNDAVFGRGGKTNNMRKGTFFRQLVEQSWTGYCAIPAIKPEEKAIFVSSMILDPIIDNGGRFLIMEGKQFIELHPCERDDYRVIMKKTMQALRDVKKTKVEPNLLSAKPTFQKTTTMVSRFSRSSDDKRLPDIPNLIVTSFSHKLSEKPNQTLDSFDIGWLGADVGETKSEEAYFLETTGEVDMQDHDDTQSRLCEVVNSKYYVDCSSISEV
jgi:hypothetical protein